MSSELLPEPSKSDVASTSGQLFQPKLIPPLREALRLRRHSLKTEKAYVQWVRRYVFFHDKRHSQAMGAVEVTAFLNHLANARHVAAATQNQALASLLFLYREVLEIKFLGWMASFGPRRPNARRPSSPATKCRPSWRG